MWRCVLPLALAGCSFTVDGVNVDGGPFVLGDFAGPEALVGDLAGADLAAAPSDLAGADLAAPPPDLTMMSLPDLTAPPIDLAGCATGCAACATGCCTDDCSNPAGCTQNCAGACSCTMSCTNTNTGNCTINCAGGTACTAVLDNVHDGTLNCAAGATCDFTCTAISATTSADWSRAAGARGWCSPPAACWSGSARASPVAAPADTA